MTQTINNISDAGKVIAKMAAKMLADKTQFLKSIDKEPASSFGQVNGYNIGDTIKISKPARFIPSTSADVTSAIQDVVEQTTTLTLDTRKVVPIALTSAQIQNTLALKDWTNRILDPAVSSIAQHIEAGFLDTAMDATYNSVGTAGSNTFDTDTMLSARQKLMENLCPMDSNVYALLNSKAMRYATGARKGLPNPSSEIAKQYKEGYVTTMDGFHYLENNLVPKHENGADVAFEVRTTVSTEGQSTLVVEGLTTSTTGIVKKGTVFTIATVNSVHPITKADTGVLKQFVVTADANSDASGYATLSISPAIYTSGADNGLQNVTAFPADGDTITPVGSASTTYAQNLAFHKSAFRFASVPLMKPSDAHMTAQETVDGMTMRVWMASDILTDKMIMRLDFLGGFAAVRPEWSVRITE